MKYQPRIVVAFFKSEGIPEPVLEHKFHETRKWRFDFSWPIFKVALEVEGGLWIAGGHSRGSGRVKDIEKYNEAACLNWRILYCQPKEICTIEMACKIKRSLMAEIKAKALYSSAKVKHTAPMNLNLKSIADDLMKSHMFMPVFFFCPVCEYVCNERGERVSDGFLGGKLEDYPLQTCPDCEMGV
jgi:hypothetical protein